MGILAAGLGVFFLSQLSVEDTAQPEFFSQDIIEVFSTTDLKSVNNRYIDEHVISGNITNKDNTILEQIGEYYHTGKMGEAQNLTINLTYNLVPSQYNFEIWFNGELLQRRGVLTDKTPGLSSSKAMITGIINRSVFWGPYKAEVRVWQ